MVIFVRRLGSMAACLRWQTYRLHRKIQYIGLI